MAKLGLLFIAAFCFIQLTTAYRVRRDTPVETSTTNYFDTFRSKVAEGLSTIQQQAKETFTKENADKLWTGIQQGVKDGQERLSELGKDVQKKFGDLTATNKNNNNNNNENINQNNE